MATKGEWIGVDLDGTLAEWQGHKGATSIGKPIPAMIDKVRDWLARGYEVRIFTARVDGGTAALAAGNQHGHEYQNVEAIKAAIRAWCREHIGRELAITNVKDYGMTALYDDLARQIDTNTGKPSVERVGDQLVMAMTLIVDAMKLIDKTAPGQQELQQRVNEFIIGIGDATDPVEYVLNWAMRQPIPPSACTTFGNLIASGHPEPAPADTMTPGR